MRSSTNTAYSHPYQEPMTVKNRLELLRNSALCTQFYTNIKLSKNILIQPAYLVFYSRRHA